MKNIFAPAHWHPNQDYCIICDSSLEHSSYKNLVVECGCGQLQETHNVYQRVHHKCLNDFKKKNGVSEIPLSDLLKQIGIEVPLK